MKDNTPASSTEAEQAMQQILQAERDAEHAIEDCEIKARQSIHQAQVKAQRIHTRANQRISNMEMRHGHKLNQLIKDIDRETAATLKHDASHCRDEKKLRSVVEKLAAELCGADSASDGDVETVK